MRKVSERIHIDKKELASVQCYKQLLFEKQFQIKRIEKSFTSFLIFMVLHLSKSRTQTMLSCITIFTASKISSLK